MRKGLQVVVLKGKMYLHLLRPGGSPTKQVSANHVKSGQALTCFIEPATKKNEIKDLTGLNFVADTVSPRTTPLNIDFTIVNPSELAKAPFQNSCKWDAKFECKVVIKDCFEEVLTAKSKALNAHQDNTHSVHSRSSSDKDFLSLESRGQKQEGKNSILL